MKKTLQKIGSGRGIRTPVTLQTPNGFQDRRNQPDSAIPLQKQLSVAVNN
tara:strand:+ start:893 stop:1042 length:150 start_codon:yes stop_codon:yes gene_type:complete